MTKFIFSCDSELISSVVTQVCGTEHCNWNIGSNHGPSKGCAFKFFSLKGISRNHGATVILRIIPFECDCVVPRVGIGPGFLRDSGNVQDVDIDHSIRSALVIFRDNEVSPAVLASAVLDNELGVLVFRILGGHINGDLVRSLKKLRLTFIPKVL